jgi:hypothetical protein
LLICFNPHGYEKNHFYSHHLRHIRILHACVFQSRANSSCGFHAKAKASSKTRETQTSEARQTGSPAKAVKTRTSSKGEEAKTSPKATNVVNRLKF